MMVSLQAEVISSDSIDRSMPVSYKYIMEWSYFIKTLSVATAVVMLCHGVSSATDTITSDDAILRELTASVPSNLEELVAKSSPYESVEGFASYYAKRFEGRRTTSGKRYNPDKLTAAHQSLPLGTVVKVVNLSSRQEVYVTVTDRCAPKKFHFIDLSRAAAKKIGLWGKGKIKVVIAPLLDSSSEDPS